MGDRGNPYGVLCWMWNRSNVWLPILRDAVCCVRNDLVHFLTDAGKPLSCRTSTAHSGLRLSKKLDMLNIRRAEMCPACLVAWMRCMRVAAALQVLCCGQDPNWDINMSWWFSMSHWKHLAIMFSRSL